MEMFSEEESLAIDELKSRVAPWLKECGNKYGLEYVEEPATLWRYVLGMILHI